MTINSERATHAATLHALEASLEQMMNRLEALVVDGPLTQDGLVEITSIYNNVAYLFLYLEANEEHISYQDLLPWRAAFHDNPSLRRRILYRVLELRCADPEAEESRVAYLKQLETADAAVDVGFDDQLSILLAEAKSVVEQIRKRETALLERLGGAPLSARPAAVIYQLISRTESADMRAKLARVWSSQRAIGRDDLLRSIESMVEIRRHRSAAMGYKRVADEILAKCTVRADDIEVFLENYLENSLVNQENLLSEVRDVVGARHDLFQHFGYYVRTVAGESKAPKLSLDDCLNFVFSVAKSIFGLEFEIFPAIIRGVTKVAVSSSLQSIGEIHFDLWGQSSGAPANCTRGLRNRTEWGSLTQLPVAHVFCGFYRHNESRNTLTFQNVHSLFHEFGHAINHLLIRKRISNRSGLEYLPLERLEYLSMWFEKWVYHPAFVDAVCYSDRQREGVQRCQRVKALEYRGTFLERGILAALDFGVHCRTDGGLEDAFRMLGERYAIEGHCVLDDLLEYFTWPMFQANPGANFTYLWGAAFSAEQFSLFETLDLPEVAGRRDLGAIFASCFDFDLITRPPACESLFSYYERLSKT